MRRSLYIAIGRIVLPGYISDDEKTQNECLKAGKFLMMYSL